MSDPWDAFDPDAAAAIKAAWNYQLQNSDLFREMERFEQEQHDRALADTEKQMRSTHKDYDKNRDAILRFAIDSGIADLEHAYSAWRGTQGQPSNGQSPQAERSADVQQENATQKRIDEIDSRLRELKHKSDEDSLDEKKSLKAERADLIDESVKQDLRATNDPDAGRVAMLREANALEDKHQSDQRDRRAMGSFGGPLHSKEAQRIAMDLDVLDHSSGRKPLTAPKSRSRQDRDADREGLTKDDRQIVAALRQQNANERGAGAPPVAEPTAESVISDAANQA